MPSSESERFDEVWSKYAGAIHGYAARRVGRDRADDVVSEVFAVVWRRIDDLPDRALPWLYGVARNVIRESRRADTRQLRLQEHLESVRPPLTNEADLDRVLAAFLSLVEDDQEALRLVVWEQLRPREAAESLGISSAAFRMRLSRARRRLRGALHTDQAVEREV